jgi:hypothetical protein
MGSEMTPGMDEHVNQHALIVKLINHTGLANQSLSEMRQTQGPKFLEWCATFGVFSDVTQGVFEFLIDLLPDSCAKACDDVALNVPKVWLGGIQNLDAPFHGC